MSQFHCTIQLLRSFWGEDFSIGKSWLKWIKTLHENIATSSHSLGCYENILLWKGQKDFLQIYHCLFLHPKREVWALPNLNILKCCFMNNWEMLDILPWLVILKKCKKNLWISSPTYFPHFNQCYCIVSTEITILIKNTFKALIPLLLIQKKKTSQKISIHKRKIFLGSPIYKCNPSTTAAVNNEEPKATDLITGHHWLRSHENLGWINNPVFYYWSIAITSCTKQTLYLLMIKKCIFMKRLNQLIM